MKAEELRLNNFVLIDNEVLPECKGDIFIVTAIQYRTDKDFPDSDSVISVIPSIRSWRNYSQFSEFINPIPLTEEWLLKFGFKKPAYSFICDIFHLTEWDNFPNNWCVAMNKNNAVIIKKLHYVHQLQNLYYALTASKLTIEQGMK